METVKLHPKFTEFDLPADMQQQDATVAIPVSNGMQQRYFFINMKTGKGLKVEFPKRKGLLTIDSFRFLRHLLTFVMNKNHKVLPRLRPFFRRYHNGISFPELLFKVSKPHGITYIGDQKFLVSLWSSSTFFVIDVKNKTMELQMLDKKRDEVFSTYQYYEANNQETYFATQLGTDEWYKHDKEAIEYDVPVVIKKYNWHTKKVSELWKGIFDTDTHYIALNSDASYLGLVQFGDFFDENNTLLPSKILVLDLKTNKEWWIDNTGWSPSAHIDWDPVEPDVCYLSCHNGVIVPVDNPLKFLYEKVYKWNIFGPASVHKYKITSQGPEKIGIFTHPEIFRLTIHKVFLHKKIPLIACTGFPNFIFIADATSMEFIRKVEIKETCGMNSVVGSLHPSPDGEKVFLITTRSFQIVDVACGKIDSIVDLGKINDPFNHMTSAATADW
jgi:hypothetical protein